MIRKLVSAGVIALVGLSGAAKADTWTLDGEASRVSFGSIKKDKVGEAHGFSGLSGSVSDDGAVQVTIDLNTVETNIDIRNERMIEHVFKGVGEAAISAQVDMDELNGLAVGASTLVDVEGVLSFLGTDIELEAEMFAMRVAENRVLVTSNDLLFLSTEEAGITAGIDKLMELAKLPGITRTAPVMLRFVFTSDVKKAEAAPAAAAATQVAAVTGDVKAGKKAFRKCKACHTVKAGKHKTGPSLHGIIGQPAAAVEGFDKYSKALRGAEIVWTEDALRAFLADPKGAVKGTSMSFRGVKKAEDIDNLLAYLASES